MPRVTDLDWLALLLGFIAVVAAAARLGVQAMATWRALRSFQRRLARTLAELEASVARTERRLDKASEAAARLAAAQLRLQRSLATASVLAEAAGEPAALLESARAFLPRK
jgi:hypothetical protein